MGEALLRHLLFLEAAALATPPSTTRACKKSTSRQRRVMEFTADKPEDWRVTFRCIMDRGRPRRHAPAQAGEASAVHRDLPSAWPLAERYEALIRVFNNPAPYAKRLARRLRTQPSLIESVLTTTDDFAHRVDSTDLIAHCDSARPTFSNSS